MKVFSPVSGGQVVVFDRPLVEPLRLFHPTVLLCIEKEQNKKPVNALASPEGDIGSLKMI